MRIKNGHGFCNYGGKIQINSKFNGERYLSLCSSMADGVFVLEGHLMLSLVGCGLHHERLQLDPAEHGCFRKYGVDLLFRKFRLPELMWVFWHKCFVLDPFLLNPMVLSCKKVLNRQCSSLSLNEEV